MMLETHLLTKNFKFDIKMTSKDSDSSLYLASVKEDNKVKAENVTH